MYKTYVPTRGVVGLTFDDRWRYGILW